MLAVLMALLGIFTGAIGLLLIAFFVYVGGSAELEAVSSRAVLRRFRAGEALTHNAVTLYTSERLERATQLIMNSYQTDYPVRDLAGQFVGVLTRQRLVDGLRQFGPEARIVDVMAPAASIPRCTPDSDLASVWEMMSRTGSRVVAVERENQVLGIITSDDISEVFQVMGAALQAGRQPPAPPANRTETPETHGYV
jgi:CBS domain-containing protein